MRLTPADAARKMGYNRSTICRWMQQGRLRSDSRGRVLLSAVERLTFCQKNAGRPASDNLPCANPFYVIPEVTPPTPRFRRLLAKRGLLKMFGPEAQRDGSKWRLRGDYDDARVAFCSIGLRGQRLDLREVQLLSQRDFLLKRPELERAIHGCEIRILAHVLDILFFSRKQINEWDGIAMHQYHSGCTGYAANFFQSARQYMAFFKLNPLPAVEDGLAKIHSSHTAREIAVSTALLILGALKGRGPTWEFCELPRTKADREQFDRLFEQAKASSEDFGEMFEQSKAFRRTLGIEATRNTARGFTLHWLLGISSRMAAYWRKRTRKTYPAYCQQLRLQGLLPAQAEREQSTEGRCDHDEIVGIFREYERGDEKYVPEANNTSQPAAESKPPSPVSAAYEERRLSQLVRAVQECPDVKMRAEFIRNLADEDKAALKARLSGNAL